jgi:hypothetical protein
VLKFFQHIIDIDLNDQRYQNLELGEILLHKLNRLHEHQLNSNFQIHQIVQWEERKFVIIINEYYGPSETSH